MAGGAPIVLSGLNFAGTTAQNSWKFEPRWLENAEVWGPPLTSDEQQNSNDMKGRLSIYAPPVDQLMDTEYHLFDGEYLPTGYWFAADNHQALYFSTVIRNFEDNWDVACANGGRCTLGYSRDYTPVMLDITPPNVCEGQEMHMHINPRGAHSERVTPLDQPPYRSLHMGDYLIDTVDIIEDTDRLNGWVTNFQYAIMTDSASMNSTTPRVLFYNGLAQMLRGMTHCNFAGDDCWTVRVHPRLTTVNFNDGYTTGGQEIHITGVTLNGTNVDVQVGGSPCDIVERDFDFITCVTRASEPSQIGYQPGQPGLTYIQNTEDYQEYLQLASTFEVLHLNSSNPVSGWFLAPATGQYRFYISC